MEQIKFNQITNTENINLMTKDNSCKKNNSNVFSEMEDFNYSFKQANALKTQALYNLEPHFNASPSIQQNSITKLNRCIKEPTSQGATGDCWLLAALYALNSNEKGKEIIKKSIIINKDHSVTVNFKGAGKSYTIKQDKILKHDTDSNKLNSYANGDNDILVLELATEELLKDIHSGDVVLDTSNLTLLESGSEIGEGGIPSQMIYYLTGIESENYYSNNTKEGLNKDKVFDILNNAYKNSNSTILTFGLYEGVHNAKLTDGTPYSINLNCGHAFAITELSQNTCSFVNPHDSSKTYTMTWEEFANLNAGRITSTDLSY